MAINDYIPADLLAKNGGRASNSKLFEHMISKTADVDALVAKDLVKHMEGKIDRPVLSWLGVSGKKVTGADALKALDDILLPVGETYHAGNPKLSGIMFDLEHHSRSVEHGIAGLSESQLKKNAEKAYKFLEDAKGKIATYGKQLAASNAGILEDFAALTKHHMSGLSTAHSAVARSTTPVTINGLAGIDKSTKNLIAHTLGKGGGAVVTADELKTVLDKFGERSTDVVNKIKELTSTQGEQIANMTKHVEEQIAKVQTITKVAPPSSIVKAAQSAAPEAGNLLEKAEAGLMKLADGKGLATSIDGHNIASNTLGVVGKEEAGIWSKIKANMLVKENVLENGVVKAVASSNTAVAFKAGGLAASVGAMAIGVKGLVNGHTDEMGQPVEGGSLQDGALVVGGAIAAGLLALRGGKAMGALAK